jgi:hypothetical protein
MSVKDQVVLELEKIRHDIRSDKYNDEEMREMLATLKGFDQKTEELGVTIDDIVTYLFRGWFITKVLEGDGALDQAE